MRPRSFLPKALAALVLSAAGLLPAAASASPQLPPTASPVAEQHIPSCPGPAPQGSARCYALVRTDAGVRGVTPAPHAQPTAGTLGNNGAYDPAYLQSAYDLAKAAASSGSGQTIAIVDAYDDPNAESDMGSYRSFFGLSSCTTANGCFRKVNENGVQGSYPSSNGGWAQEISLDLDMASAICPNCKILLVEASSANLTDLGTAVNTAVALGASVVSNSYGGSEYSGETSDEASYYQHPGIPVTVSSGDSGYGVEFPAASQYVTAVGGTTLNQATNTGTRNATETVWSGAGSGCSAYEPKPTWQKDTGCTNRTVADVSADADPNTGVWVYDSYAYQGLSGWLVFGGTSVASPIVASTYALAGSSSSTASAYPSSYPYASTGSLNDVTSGSNGSCTPAYLCTGEVGFDGPSGDGTPNGTTAFAAATAPVATFSLAATPSSASAAPGSSTSYSLTLTASGGYASPVNLSVSGLPTGASATFSANPVTPTSSGAGSTLTVSTSASTPGGSYTLTITGKGTDASSTTQSTSVTLNVPDFTLSASPTSASVAQGATASYTTTLQARGGYSSTVNLSVSGLPTGATGTFTPASVTPTNTGATSSLAVATTASTPTGTYTLTIAGTDASGLTRSTTVSLQVTAPVTGFTLSASPTSSTAAAGSGTSYAVSATATNGYSSPVSFSVAGLPTGATASFAPSSVTPSASGSSSTLTVNTSASTPSGSYTLTVTGTGSDSAQTTASTTVTLVVTGTFTATVTPSSQTVKRGGKTSYTVSLGSLGYSNSVQLSVSGLPKQTSASFSTNPVTLTPGANATVTLTVSTRRNTSTGTFTLTVTGKGADGTTVNAAPVTLTVTP